MTGALAEWRLFVNWHIGWKNYWLNRVIGWMSHYCMHTLAKWVIGEWNHWLNGDHWMNDIIGWMEIIEWTSHWLNEPLVYGVIGWMSHWWMGSWAKLIIGEWKSLNEYIICWMSHWWKGSLDEWVIDKWGHWLNESLVNTNDNNVVAILNIGCYTNNFWVEFFCSWHFVTESCEFSEVYLGMI